MKELIRRFKWNWVDFWQLERWERKFFLQAIILIPVISFALRFVSFKRIYLSLSRLSSHVKPIKDLNENDASAYQKEVETITNLVSKAVWRWIYPSTCLPRSLTLFWCLRRAGFQAEFYIGVKKSEQVIEAHAWIEYLGKVLNDDPDIRKQFAPFEVMHV